MLADLQRRLGQQLLTAKPVGDDQLPIRQTARLALYRNNVQTSLNTALAKNFPVVALLVGEDFLKGMAAGFLQRFPPTSRCLHEFGGDFPKFIRHFPPARGLPYLAKVAEFEWLHLQCQQSAEVQGLSQDMLAAYTPEQLLALQVQLHPATRVMTGRYPVDLIWQAHQQANPADQLANIDLTPRPRHWLIWRSPDAMLWHKSIDAVEARMLRQLLMPQPWGDGMERLMALAAPRKIQQLLAFLLYHQLLIASPQP